MKSAYLKIIDAMLAHVVATGWSATSFKAAIRDAKVDPKEAERLFPKGAKDVAKAVHRRDDEKMLAAIEGGDFSRHKLREKIAEIVMLRFETMALHKDAIRASVSFFALPHNHVQGCALIWESADKIWRAVGDSSNDFNWYSKRTILSAVYMSTLIYWLEDNTPNCEATRAFLERRIGDVMGIEKIKANLRKSSIFAAGEEWLNQAVRKYHVRTSERFRDVPGSLGRQK